MPTLLFLALLAAFVATLAGILIRRRSTRRIQALIAAAERIGRGDLWTPAPRAPGGHAARRGDPQRAAGGGPAGATAARRDRRRSRPPAARRRARQHLPRIPHPALGPARLA